MTPLKHRPWVPNACEDYVQQLAQQASTATTHALAERIETLVTGNRTIHERECFNLNLATKVMNPRAEIRSVAFSPSHR